MKKKDKSRIKRLEDQVALLTAEVLRLKAKSWSAYKGTWAWENPPRREHL